MNVLIYRKDLKGITVFLFILILLIILSPNENTLGSTIKYVYLHVSLIWCVGLGLILVALLLLARPVMKNKIYSFQDLELLSIFSISAYSVGILLSLISARIAWGSIYWQEPYMDMSIKLIVISILSLVTINLFPKMKFIYYLLCVPGIYYIFAIINIQGILHPDNPIGSSPSPSIKLSFALFFILFLSFFIWLFFKIRKTPKLNI